MCEIIQFKSGTSSIFEKKYRRKVELCVKRFNQDITDNEEIELDELCKWLKIDNNY